LKAKRWNRELKLSKKPCGRPQERKKTFGTGEERAFRLEDVVEVKKGGAKGDGRPMERELKKK